MHLGRLAISIHHHRSYTCFPFGLKECHLESFQCFTLRCSYGTLKKKKRCELTMRSCVNVEPLEFFSQRKIRKASCNSMNSSSLTCFRMSRVSKIETSQTRMAILMSSMCVIDLSTIAMVSTFTNSGIGCLGISRGARLWKVINKVHPIVRFIIGI